MFAGSRQNDSDNCILCSAVVKWCEGTTFNHSAIFNNRYVLFYSDYMEVKYLHIVFCDIDMFLTNSVDSVL